MCGRVLFQFYSNLCSYWRSSLRLCSLILLVFSMMTRSGRRVVLHVDVNKTIVMADSAQNQSLRETLNMALAETCYGTVNDAGEFVWNGELPSALNGPATHTDNAISYRKYSWQVFPDPEPGTNFAEFKKAKKARRQLTGRFAESEGPASSLSRVLDKLEREQDGIFLADSFLSSMWQLHQSDMCFSVIFRTFGDDYEEVVSEWNDFCLGKHPRYPQVSMPQRVVEKVAAWERRENDVWLHTDTVDNEGSGASSTLRSLAEAKAWYLRNTADGHSLFIRDHWYPWRKAGERAHQGKVLPIAVDMQGRLRADEPVQIFFDDNVQPERAKIVDVVATLPNGQRLYQKDIWRRFCIRVDPLEVMTQLDYFDRHVRRVVEQETQSSPTQS
ncbi:MAG: hypothetical protein MHM6MM_000531 [Cercozoa sp. M6MM]